MSKKADDKSEFVQGVAYACAELVRNGEPSHAEWILLTTVRSVKELVDAKVDEYDLKDLRKLFPSQ